MVIGRSGNDTKRKRYRWSTRGSGFTLVDIISIFYLSNIRSFFLVDISILILLSPNFRVKIILVR